MREILPFFLVALCTLFGLASARAQTPVLPAPTPTVIVLPIPRPALPGSGTICSAPTHAGGQTVSPFPIGGSLQIALPAGKFEIYGGISDPGGEFIRVCYVEGNSVIFFDPQGREKSRVVNNPAANSVLDEIAKGIKVGPQPAAPYGAPPVNNVCGIAPRGASAGDSVRFGSPLGVIAITLPPSGSYQFAIPGEIPGSAHGIFICDGATASTVLLDWRNGQELARIVLSSAGGPALDRIVAGVQFQPAPPAPLAPFVPFEPPAFRPPDTGDAGLVGLGALS